MELVSDFNLMPPEFVMVFIYYRLLNDMVWWVFYEYEEIKDTLILHLWAFS